MSDDDKHGWTHPICDDCWWNQEAQWRDDGTVSIRQPVRVKKQEGEFPWEQCCRCGAMTTSGIFVRQNDEELVFCPGS